MDCPWWDRVDGICAIERSTGVTAAALLVSNSSASLVLYTPMMPSMIMTRFRTVPQVIYSWEPGKVGGLRLNGKNIDPAEHWVLKKGDRVVMETAGGGGYGNST